MRTQQNGYERNGDISINYTWKERSEINNFRSHTCNTIEPSFVHHYVRLCENFLDIQNLIGELFNFQDNNYCSPNLHFLDFLFGR